ncbi:MAG: asparagine synthase C-terminal domain-containing protein [Acidilobus sp.]
MGDQCLELADELLKVVGDELRSNGCDCILFSGGIDTSLVALSAVMAGLRPRLITVLYRGARDEVYASHVAQQLGLSISFVRSSEEKSLRCVDEALVAMETIDPIEVISASAVCAGLSKAKELGCKCVATGDGGDELFIGYDFLLGKGIDELRDWLKRVVDHAFFNSAPMGAHLGLRVVLPLYSQRAKEIAARSLDSCSVRSLNGRPYGKFLLRLALAVHGLDMVAWRPKDPITRGSGVELLLSALRGRIGINESLALSRSLNIILPSRAHAYLLRRRLELGAPLPPRASGANACPICGRAMRGSHCPFCGAYVSENGVSVYSDELLGLTRQQGT